MKLPPAELELMATMANIEARSKVGGAFIKAMVSATGLTKDQICHRRAKGIYQHYLDIAKKKVADEWKKLFQKPISKAPSNETSASTSKAEAPIIKVIFNVLLPTYSDVQSTAENITGILGHEKETQPH